VVGEDLLGVAALPVPLLGDVVVRARGSVVGDPAVDDEVSFIGLAKEHEDQGAAETVARAAASRNT
jgi:hypothetical protein